MNRTTLITAATAALALAGFFTSSAALAGDEASAQPSQRTRAEVRAEAVQALRKGPLLEFGPERNDFLARFDAVKPRAQAQADASREQPAQRAAIERVSAR